MKSPKFKLRNYRFFWVSWGITAPKHHYLNKVWFKRVLCFAIEDVWSSRLLRDAAFSWWPGRLFGGLKTLPNLGDFLSKHSLSLNKFHFNPLWVFQAMNSRISRNTKKQIFLLVSGGHICAPQRDTKMASPYKALQIWVKRFSKYLPYKISHRPDSWRSLRHIYLLLIYFLDSGLGEGGGLPYERDGDARRLA